MSAALRLSDPLLPPPPGGLGRGALLAVAIHGGLVVALTLGVQWRAQPVEVVAAELWAAVPQQAAPAAEAPPPAPEPQAPTPMPAPAPPEPVQAAEREADIALERRKQEREREQQRQAELERERERQQKIEAERRERAEAERRQRLAKAQQEERERKAAEARLAQQREENLKRMMGQAGGSGGTGTARQDAAPSLAYGSRLIAHIKPNIVFTDSISGNPTAEVEVRAAPSGTIIARRLIKSSGVREWDEAVLRAIDRTSVLPRDSDGRVPPLLIIGFRPND